MELSLSSLLLVLMIGIVFFAVSVIAMVVLFGISTADVLKKPRELVILFITSVSLPLMVINLSSRTNLFTQAGSHIKVIRYQIISSSATQSTVAFETNKPVFGYLEIKSIQSGVFLPVLPQYPLSLKTSHTVTFPTSSPEVWIVLNGQRVINISN